MLDIFGTLLFLTIVPIGLFVLFLTAELMHYQRGRDTWSWVKRVYHRYNLHRVRW